MSVATAEGYNSKYHLTTQHKLYKRYLLSATGATAARVTLQVLDLRLLCSMCEGADNYKVVPCPQAQDANAS